MYASRDGGATWNSFYGPGSWTSFDLVVDPFAATTLYLVANYVPPAFGTPHGGFFRSTDGGVTWTAIDLGLGLTSSTITRVVAAPSTSGMLYLATTPVPGFPGTPQALFKTFDSGATWVYLTSSLGQIQALAVDPTNPSIVYAGGDPSVVTNSLEGVFKSVDGGGTFTHAYVTPSSQIINDLRIDPVHPNRVYAATTAGVFASSDGGASWQSMNAGLTDLTVYTLAIDAGGTHLHAGTSSGVFDYQFATDPAVLSLDPGRSFSVTLAATDQRTGRTGAGLAIPVSNIFGYFSIPAITGNPGNPEVFVKMLDGRPINGEYWFFYGGLTDLEYTLTVTDDATGQMRTYSKAAGSECGGSDTAAFGP